MIETFEQLLEKHGDSPASLGWSEQGQRQRFAVLSEIGIGCESTVLDVGCGLGHFCRYLREEKAFTGRYIGIDVSKAMIEEAQKINSGAFICRDALDGEPFPLAGFVVSSGMLNANTAYRGISAIHTLITKCFRAARRGVAINMLSDNTDKRADGHSYYDPGRVLDEALTITNRVVLRHDYRDNDFTLYLYKP